ncbi:MAG: group 1 truncated hemoglobin [Myxococcota bacterium]
MSDFVRIGGEPKLRAIIDEFVDGCFDDVMIGFLFMRANRDRVKRFEYQHAAAHLGAEVTYEGRPIRNAHKAHVIFGGHFDRRLTILRNTLRNHDVDTEIEERWIAYHQSLRAEVTADPDSNCNDGVRFGTKR